MKRIAILGGGMSSLVTAFELTSLPDWKQRYSITVYQMGWRLGGKGASGRNATLCNRNEEHGLHLLFGCYENAFRVLRRCYTEVVRDAKELPWTIDDAVKPHDAVSMFEDVDGKWLRWDLDLPRCDGEPGVGPPLHLSPLVYVQLLIRWARQQAEKWPQAALGIPTTTDSWWNTLLGGIESLLAAVRSFLHTESSGLLHAPIVYLHQAETVLEALKVTGAAVTPHGTPHDGLDTVVELVDRFHDWTRTQRDVGTELRRLRIMIDFALAVSKGLLVDRVLFPRENWFAIDRWDLREWLARHGADAETCNSALVIALYDAVFGPPTQGAGTILHALYRASNYKGAVLYKMQAGMGDTIFAPLYRVLRARGVRFEFFHRVENLELSADRSRVERVAMQRQATPKRGTYEPLVLVEGVYCWPNAPLRKQLEPGVPAGTDFEDWWDPWQGTPLTLEAGKDFDLLVLGISVGAFKDICGQLVANRDKPAFGDMTDAIATTQTQGVQLWCHPTITQLGWKGAPEPVAIPYADPLNTWADMSQLIPRESFPAGAVGTQIYLCAMLESDGPPPPRPAPGYSARQRERVFRIAESWLPTYGPPVWPRAAGGGSGFDWKHLVDLDDGTGTARLRAQHIVATSNPSDRYVWAVRGSVAHRLRADQSGYDNLYLTGDWTLNGMSIGCLESATMGGVQTARAIDPRVPRAAYDWLPEPGEDAPVVQPTGPRYVVRDGEMLAPPPVGLKMNLRTFVVPASLARLEALCDKDLNLGGKTTYHPVGPFVVFYCADMMNIVTEGSIPELDFGIWVPVVAVEGHVPRRLLTYTPYIWVNNSPALVGGRTIFGFPKHVGTLSALPHDPGSAGPYTVDTWVLLEEGGVAEPLRLLEIAAHDALGAEPRPEWGSSIDAVVHHGGALGNLVERAAGLVLPTWERVVGLFRRGIGMPMVFLKQFRAADGSDAACHQAIVEATVRVTGGLRGGPVLRGYEIALLDCFSHRIAPTLGLADVQRRPGPKGHEQTVVRSIAAGWMEFEATVEPGIVMWEAPAEPPSDVVVAVRA